jgi:ParB family chromosome partitioning protein
MPRPRGLGKGLSALLSEQPSAVESGGDRPREISLDLIDPSPFQPRRRFGEEELNELAASIAEYGVIQPVVVRERGGRYELIVGERRVRASRLAGRQEIAAVVRAWSDAEALAAVLVENLQREDLNPIEAAHGLKRLMEELSWTQEQVAERVGKSRPHVANLLRMLQLDAEIQDLIAEGQLTVAHGKVLLGIDAERRVALARRAAAEGWTVKQLVAAAARDERPRAPKTADVHLQEIEARLRRALGTKVVFRGTAEKGRVEIAYRSVEELERIIGLLQQDGDSSSIDGFVV